MKVIFTMPRQNGRLRAESQEIIGMWQAIVCTIDGPLRVCVVTLYQSKSQAASVLYASLWARIGEHIETTGTGKASGNGFHKSSAAIARALDSAGIELYGPPGHMGQCARIDISGTSDHKIEETLRAIVDAMNYDGAEALIIND